MSNSRVKSNGENKATKTRFSLVQNDKATDLTNPIYESDSGITIDKRTVKDMDNNDWQKQYVSSLDRNISEIRKENAETRKEIKEDMKGYVSEIHSYIDIINTKYDLTMDIVKDIKSEMKDIGKDNSDTRKWIVGVGITVFFSVAGLILAVILKL